MTAVTNALYYGDNLVWLRDHRYFPDESVDLIYLDPPFNSKADYNVLFNEPGKGDKSQAQIQAFDDTWHWDSEASALALNELAQNRPQIAEFISWLSRQGKTQESMAAYLSMMAVRLVELHRVLRPSGSLYLHCDPTASHYLKLVLDQIFGEQNFRNEIVWKRFNFHADARRFGRLSDRVLFYTKTSDYTFNRLKVAFSDKYVESKFTHVDSDGRKYRLDNLNPPGGRGPIYKFHGVTQPWRFTVDKMLQLEADGRIYTGSKVAQLKRYLDEQEGQAVHELWTDVAPMNSQARERLGYPTQKPLALLERIIRASSNEGDTVLDPFCGCGTTIDAAQKLNRRWLGIDVTWLAIDLVEKRLKDTYGAKITSTYEVKGKPYDVASAEALANKSKKEFEIWAISLVGAHPREHDGGVDGIFGFVEQDKKTRTIIVQVKGGDMLNPGMVRDLIGTVKKEGAAIGLLITLKEPSGGMKSLAVHSEPYKSELYWNQEFPSIQIRTVAELLEGKTFDLPRSIQSPFKKARLAREDAEQIELDA